MRNRGVSISVSEQKESNFWSAEEKEQDGGRFLRGDEAAIIEAKHGNGNGKKGQDESNQ